MHWDLTIPAALGWNYRAPIKVGRASIGQFRDQIGEWFALQMQLFICNLGQRCYRLKRVIGAASIMILKSRIFPEVTRWRRVPYPTCEVAK